MNKIKQRQPFINRNIVRIVTLFMSVTVVVSGLGFTLMLRYERQTEQITVNSLESFGRQLDHNMETISGQLMNFLVNNDQIQGVLMEGDGSMKDLELIRNMNARMQLLESFQILNEYYGESYHFWYYNCKSKTFIQSGEGNYGLKKRFGIHIREQIDTGQIRINKDKKWTAETYENETYAMVTYSQNENYIGCYITLSEMFSGMLEIIEQGGIHVRDSDQQVIDTILPANMELGELEALGYVTGAYDFRYSDFSIQILDKTYLHQQALLIKAGMVVMGILIALLMLWIVWYVKRTILRPIYEEQLEKKKVELDYAQLQIRPHFYINCLNNIYSMIQMDKKKQAQSLIIYVSNYLRSVFRKGMELVRMQEELDNIRNFLEIHKILYRDGCEYKLFVQEGLENSRIPPLLIQTFAENCIKHTLDLEHSIMIQIDISRCPGKEEYMQVVISDNGEGFPESYLKENQQKVYRKEDSRFQIGLENVRDRLKMIYGEQAKITLKNQEKGGSYVKIELPAMWEEGNESFAGR